MDLMYMWQKLRELNNYNALGAILAGINGTAVLASNGESETLAES